jgi:hypothetical protein
MPPKRKAVESPQKPSAKRPRTENATPFLLLTQDIMSHLLVHLRIGEKLMLAMTNKSVYDAIEGLVQAHTPFVVQEPWSITKALRQRQTMVLKSTEDIERIKPYVQNNELHKLTDVVCLSTCSSWRSRDEGKEAASLDDYKKLFSLKTKDETITTEAVIIPRGVTTEEDVTEYEKEEKNFPYRAGCQIKHLKIQDLPVGSPDEVLIFLRMCHYVESVELSNLEISWAERKRSTKRVARVQWYDKIFPGLKVLSVDSAMNLKEVVEGADLEYKAGRGYYQVLKKEAVTAAKKIVVISQTGENDIFRDSKALAQLGLTSSKKFDIHPVSGFAIFVQSTSHNRKLAEGSYVLYEDEEEEEEESDGDGDEDGGDEDDINGAEISLPVLSKLRRFTTHAFEYDTGDSYVTQILQAAPNLQEFAYIYDCPPMDSLLEFMGNHNKELRSIMFLGYDGSTPCETDFGDEPLLELFKNTKMEKALLYHSSGVSGEIFSDLGKCAPAMKLLRIQRVAYNGDLCAQKENLLIESKLENLEELSLTDDWTLTEEFFDSLVQQAPNLKRFYLENSSYGGERVHCTTGFIKLLNSRKFEELGIAGIHLKDADFRQAIAKQHDLRKLKFWGSHDSSAYPLQDLKPGQWPHLKSLTIHLEKDTASLEALSQAAPELEKLTFEEGLRNSKNQGDIVEFLKDEGRWPKLRRFCCSFGKELNQVRPLVACEDRSCMVEGSKDQPEDPHKFFREWLYSDSSMFASKLDQL